MIMIILQMLFLLLLFVYGENVERLKIMPAPCKCVDSELCMDDDFAIDGQGLLDIRGSDGKCDKAGEVCCDNISDSSEVYEKEPSVQSLFNTCGYEVPIKPRILGGQATELGEAPWTAAILIEDRKAKIHIFRCGSSLIHPQVVLTAAHCVVWLDSNSLRIIVGDLSNIESKDFSTKGRSAKEIVIHENFNPASLKNDIALVILTEPVMPTGNARVICLPNDYLDAIGTSCMASGWGKDSFVRGNHTTKLKSVQVPLVSRAECVTQLRNTRLGPFYSLHRSFICAGGQEGKDTCTGDGGSPLYCPLNDYKFRFVQMGIVSWGIGCGTQSPGVYVNVNLFTNWIDENMVKRQLDITVYKYKQI